MPNSNFTIKVTLDEANLIREGLRNELDSLIAKLPDLDDFGRHKAGALENLLRREFGA